MLARAGPILRLLGRMFFGAVRFDRSEQDVIRSATAAGTPVYVLNAHSLLDYLYFNFAFVRFGLPLVFFANGIDLSLFRPAVKVLAWLWQHLLGRREPVVPDRDRLREGLSRGHPCLVFLKRPRALIQWGADDGAHYLPDLLALQRDLPRPLVLLPLLLVWDQKPESYRRSVVDVVFGDPQAPGRLRKLVSFVFNFRRARVQVGRPVDLRGFVAANADAVEDDTLSARLKFALASEFLLEMKAIRGPALKGPGLQDEILRTPPFQEEVRRLAARDRASPALYESRARVMLKRMAADFRFAWLETFATVLGLVFYRLFQGFVVDTNGLDEIRDAAREGPIVLVPAHRSHMDYLVFSVLFHTHGLIAPHIAAGDNLSFWPMGPIFRHSGAFFIRRRLHGDDLYSAVLAHYVRKLLKEGYWVEFFIEGTRSRTGKALTPKYGMLSMIVDAVASGAAPNAFLVPAAITYEKVLEAASYQSESAGSEKRRESLGGLAASAKVFGSRYGKVYVEFDHTMDLVGFLRREGVPVPLPPGGKVPREVVRRLAHRLMYRIDRCFVVTPLHLVAFALLAHPKRGMERSRLLDRVAFLVRFIAARGGRLSDAVTDALHGRSGRAADEDAAGHRDPAAAALAREVDDVLRILRKEKRITLDEAEGDWIIGVAPERRPGLDYYKNGILHFFVPEALVAHAILRLGSGGPVPRDALLDGVRALSRAFKFEFVFGTSDDADSSFDAVVERFVAEGLLDRDGDGLAVPAPAREAVDFLAGCIAPFVEAYRTLGRTVAGGASGGDHDIVKAALRQGRRLYLVGDVSLPESLSAVTFQNALACLRSEVRAGRAEDLAQAAADLARMV